MTHDQPPTSLKWEVGQRVERTKPKAIGTVVEVNGRMKVKWDTGGVSYYSLHQSRYVSLVNDTSRVRLAARYKEVAAQQPPRAQRDVYLKKADDLERTNSPRLESQNQNNGK